MSILTITGASGYIGTSFLQRLSADHRVADLRGIDRRQTNPMSGEMHIVDLASSSTGAISECFSGTTTVFHFAAARTDWGLSYEDYFRDNVVATRSVIEGCRQAGVSQVVYTGTVGVYGSGNSPIDESGPFNATTDYGQTKAQAERELIHAAREEGWSLRILRPSAVFSELQPPNTNIYRLVEAIRRHRFVLIGDGSEIKTTSYLHNVIDAALWLYRDLDSGGIKVFNYVDEPRLTTREMIHIIRGELGRRGPQRRLPLALVEAPAKVFDVIGNAIGVDFPITAARIRKFCTPTNFDSTAIRAAGFAPRYSSIEALKRTVAWHKAGKPDEP